MILLGVAALSQVSSLIFYATQSGIYTLMDLLRLPRVPLHRVVLLCAGHRRGARRAGCYLVCHEPSGTCPRRRAGLGLGHHCGARHVSVGDLGLAVPGDLGCRSCLRASKFRPAGHCCYANHYLRAAASRAGRHSQLTDSDLWIPYVPVYGLAICTEPVPPERLRLVKGSAIASRGWRGSGQPALRARTDRPAATVWHARAGQGNRSADRRPCEARQLQVMSPWLY